MKVESPRYDNPLHEEFFRAAQAAGLPANDDFNDWSRSQEGYGEYQVGGGAAWGLGIREEAQGRGRHGGGWAGRGGGEGGCWWQKSGVGSCRDVGSSCWVG